MSVTFDPVREAEELREQLGSDRRRLLFLFGAGTSQAVGIDGIAELSKKVRAALPGDQQPHYDRIVNDTGVDNVESVLNRLRLCSELIGSSATASVYGFIGDQASKMDRAVCRAIYDRVRIDPPKGFEIHADFAAWLASIQRDRPTEIFTTNYDLNIERGLEIAEAPYFDGFIGTVNPYFSAASCDASDDDRPGQAKFPRSWIRLWKLHGSIGWRRATEAVTGVRKVIRTSAEPSATDDLMIFPTREKYSESRRMPFVAFHDRLRRITADGESLLLVLGYSFGDQHINDILYANLRANNRLSCTVFLHESMDAPNVLEQLVKPTTGIQNLTIYSPDKAMVGGVSGKWSEPAKAPAEVGNWPFWDETEARFALGDFSKFPTFLMQFIGARPLPNAKPVVASPS